MGKDKKARDRNRMTFFALANLVVALVDAMDETGVDRFTIHAFLDRFDRLNEFGLDGMPLDFMTEIVEVVRRSVACND